MRAAGIYARHSPFLQKTKISMEKFIEDIAELLLSHETKCVKVRITAIKQHVSEIELEEIDEEYTEY